MLIIYIFTKYGSYDTRSDWSVNVYISGHADTAITSQNDITAPLDASICSWREWEARIGLRTDDNLALGVEDKVRYSQSFLLSSLLILQNK